MAEETPSRYIAFFDECGDYSLEQIDRDFPLFVLSTVIVERTVYHGQIIPAMGRLKMRFWNHEGVNLHSREIRKALGDFSFMQVPQKRALVLSALSGLMKELPITLFITAVHKQEHKQRYGMAATNPRRAAEIWQGHGRFAHRLPGALGVGCDRRPPARHRALSADRGRSGLQGGSIEGQGGTEPGPGAGRLPGRLTRKGAPADWPAPPCHYPSFTLARSD